MEFIQSDSFPKTTALQCRVRAAGEILLLFLSERASDRGEKGKGVLKHDIAPFFLSYAPLKFRLMTAHCRSPSL